MKTAGPLREARANRIVLGEIISYLMVTAVAVRGLVTFAEVRLQIAGLLVVFILLTLAERALRRRSPWGQPLFLIGQIGVMAGLFMLAPGGDYWAIMLLPACSYAMRHFRLTVAWTWIGIFIASMSAMEIIGFGWTAATEYIIIYVAAYVLIGSYALLLRQTAAAQEESQRLLQQLRQSNAQLEEYVAQVEELAAIKERNRLARELHDAVTQSIFSMTLITRSALILQERDPQQVRAKLVQLQELAQGALQEMRNLISQLRTLSVAEDGLFPVLQRFIDGVNGRNDLHIALEPAPETLPLTPEQQQELYRIIQEAVNNVVKHARAGQAAIRFAVMEAAVAVTVSDNGVGFDPAQLKDERSHIGLDSMFERTQELGGTLAIDSRPGGGTEVRVIVPVTDQRRADE